MAAFITFPIGAVINYYSSTPPAWLLSYLNGLVGITGLLMISPFKHSSKKILRIKLRPHLLFFLAVMASVCILYAPLLLCVFVLLYTAFGPWVAMCRLVRQRLA